jgi:hypothetical protein
MDSQSVVSGPQQGERSFDGTRKIKGIKRRAVTCSPGFVLAILAIVASSIHCQFIGVLGIAPSKKQTGTSCSFLLGGGGELEVLSPG